MRRFRFDATTGHAITQFGSERAAITGIQRTTAPVQIACMHIGAGGVVGYHQATTRQLFLVVAGDGWVTGADRVQHPLSAGEAAFWDAGEWHESGSVSGMTVIVIEGNELVPDQAMRATPLAE
ncbi:MAG TPA: cupin domain-containing protein [Ktedonobacterales bacterium]|nr:cupin domain-containing protein [Ktedonobacterales bacterium]